MAKNQIDLPEGIKTENLLNKLKAEKKAAFEYQKRRHDQWNENYLLYRDKIQTNRLTQRQATNIPIIKETIRTILPKIDEEPNITFEDKGGDLNKEIIVKAKWEEDLDSNNLRLLDSVDKKQVLLYGRSYKKLNWIDGEFKSEIKDIYDLLLDPGGNTIDIESNRYLVEQGIYRPYETIISNENYDEDAKNKIKEDFSSDQDGKKIRKMRENIESAKARSERLKSLGQEDIDKYEGHDKILELNQQYTNLWDKKEKKFIRYVVLVAEEKYILRAKPIKKELDVEFWPFEGWADDLEITDVWSDSIADILRTPNQIMNIWLSQLMENRTFRNMGMNFYDSTIEGFDPDGFDPRPFGWYPLPGKPSEVYQKVEIPSLGGTKEDIGFLISIAERASATGAVEKGVVERARRTLGEIEIAVGKAEQRTTSMSKFYRLSWKRYAEKWYALHEANMTEKVKLYKKAPNGKLVGKEFKKEQITSKEGYKIIAQNTTELVNDKIDEIQKLQAIKGEFPDNPPLNKAIQKRLISLADLTPEEAQEIEAYEVDKIEREAGGRTGEQEIITPEELERGELPEGASELLRRTEEIAG